MVDINGTDVTEQQRHRGASPRCTFTTPIVPPRIFMILLRLFPWSEHRHQQYPFCLHPHHHHHHHPRFRLRRCDHISFDCCCELFFLLHLLHPFGRRSDCKATKSPSVFVCIPLRSVLVLMVPGYLIAPFHHPHILPFSSFVVPPPHFLFFYLLYVQYFIWIEVYFCYGPELVIVCAVAGGAGANSGWRWTLKRTSSDANSNNNRDDRATRHTRCVSIRSRLDDWNVQRCG